MAALFLIRDNLANKISYYHLLLLMASLPFDRFYSHIILISFAVHTLIQFNRQQIKPVLKFRTILLQSVFLITVFSTIYTANRTAAIEEWGKQIVILLLPLLFCFTTLDLKKYRSSLLLGFSLVCTATVLYLYADAFYTIRHYHLSLLSLFSNAFVNHNFSEPIHMHATFFSMQLAIALIYLITVLINKHSFYTKLFYLACICLLLAGLVQLSSKSVCFCLVFILNLAVPYFLLPKSKRWKGMLITASVSIVFIILILNLHTFKERFITELRTDLSGESTAEITDPRLARWDAIVELIAKSPVIGYGAGSEYPLLQETFYARKYYSSYLHKLNSHSQYLSFLLKSGITGFLIYIATLIFGFKVSFTRKELLFFTFMSLVAFVSFSENLLDVDKGIFFYAFFFSFFVFTSGEDKAMSINQQPND